LRPEAAAATSLKTAAALPISRRRPSRETAVPNHRFLSLCAIALLAAGCSKKDPAPAPAKPASTVVHSRSAAPDAPRERREYSDMPTGSRSGGEAGTTTAAHTIEAEALRGGPRGEARIFENAQEQAELARGNAPKYMNGQFRYYLGGLSFLQQDGACRSPVLAIRLAVENQHGNPTAAIRGRLTFSRSVGGDGASQMTETIGIPYHLDIVGPFSDKRGGITYVTAHVERGDAFLDPKRWAEIAAINPARLKVWFTPEVFYYPDGTQYSPQSGRGPAAHDVVTCGGGEGAVRAIAP
jgi:hypothetical protein